MYKNLNINQDKLISSIENYLSSEKYEYHISNDFHKIDSTRRRVYITIQDKTFFMDFHFRSDGTTTIDIDSGKNEYKEIRKKTADYILNFSDCVIGRSIKKEAENFIIKNINADTLKEVKEIFNILEEEQLLLSCDKVESNEEKEIYKLIGPQSDIVTLTLYKNKNKKYTLLVQGKPLVLYSEIFTYFTRILDRNDVSKLYEAKYGEDIIKMTEEKLITKYLPHAYEKIQSIYPLNRLIKQSIYDLEKDAGNDDIYDGYIIAAIRAMEGFLKIIMSNDYGIDIPKDKLPEFIPEDKNVGRFRLNHKDREKIGSREIVEYIEDCYIFYNKSRHKHVHYNSPNQILKWGETTAILKSKNEADVIIKEVLKRIDYYYKVFKHKKER